jgi:Fe(3+) dicitrate transport protein
MNEMYKLIYTTLSLLIFSQGIAQNKASDSTLGKNLPDVTVVGRNSKSDYQQMPEIVGTNIYAGKKML